MSDIVYAAFFLMAASVDCVFMYKSVVDIISSLNSEHWPQTPGVILEMSDTTAEVGEGDVHRSYKCYYSYNVGGKTYGSYLLSYKQKGVSLMSSHTLEMMMDKYPVGKDILVHYNPKHPHQSVVEKGCTPSLWGALSIQIIVLIVASIFIYGFATHQVKRLDDSSDDAYIELKNIEMLSGSEVSSYIF